MFITGEMLDLSCYIRKLNIHQTRYINQFTCTKINLVREDYNVGYMDYFSVYEVGGV